MGDLLKRGPFDRRTPFELAEPFRRFFEGDMDKSMIRVEEEVKDGVMTIRAELPGVDPDKDIDISVEGGALHLRAERQEQKRDQEEGSFRSEFRYGSFYRSVPLPADVEADSVRASYKDGVLEVKVPVPATPPEQAPRRIRVDRTP